MILGFNDSQGIGPRIFIDVLLESCGCEVVVTKPDVTSIGEFDSHDVEEVFECKGTVFLVVRVVCWDVGARGDVILVADGSVDNEEIGRVEFDLR